MPIPLEARKVESDLSNIDEITAAVLSGPRRVHVQLPPALVVAFSKALLDGLDRASRRNVFVADNKLAVGDMASRLGLAEYHSGEYTGHWEDHRGVATIAWHVGSTSSFDDHNVLWWDWTNLASKYVGTSDFEKQRGALDSFMRKFADEVYPRVIALSSTDLFSECFEQKYQLLFSPSGTATVELVPYNNLRKTLADSICAEPERNHVISLVNKGATRDKVAKEVKRRGKFKVLLHHFGSNTLNEVANALRGQGGKSQRTTVFTTSRTGAVPAHPGWTLHIVPRGPVGHSVEEVASTAWLAKSSSETTTIKFYADLNSGPKSSPDAILDILDAYRSELVAEAQVRIERYRAELQGSQSEFRSRLIKTFETVKHPYLIGRHHNLVSDDLTVNETQVHHYVWARRKTIQLGGLQSLQHYLALYDVTLNNAEAHVKQKSPPRSPGGIEGPDFDAFLDAYYLEGRRGQEHDQTQEEAAPTDKAVDALTRVAEFLGDHVGPSRAEIILRAVGPDSTAINLALKQVQNHVRPQSRAFLDALINAFEIGERMSPETLYGRYVGVQHAHPTREGVPESSRVAVRRLRGYFILERKGRGTNMEWKVVSQDPVTYYLDSH